MSEDSEISDISIQEPLLSLEVVSMRPALGGTAHLKNTVIASDGLEYAVKSVNDGETSELKGLPNPKQIPASEWLCTRLGEMCGLPTPPCRVIYCAATDEYFFGSRYDLAASSRPEDEVNFASSLMAQSPILRKQVWAIYAFDQFVFNIDRHLKNYLYTKNRDGDVTVQAFDFSLAAMVMGWPNKTGDGLIPPGYHTTNYWSSVKSLTYNDKTCRDSAIQILDKLSSVNTEDIERIFLEMPGQWINPLHKNALTSWWGSPGRDDRVSAVKTEVLK
ncbi:Uncharacterized protein related to capsule biosynthesis enzymes [Serratia plymuthica]|uniref:HipA domain-containing protein n=1 Tax=Serratia plymuthica TaxID=82996 RepID=UPI002179DABF|nr:HipA domain-containing protein [Serratia plymuthica]CAI0874006.1 Uncharacterized protein related to capsule biosynthesis enzymes [Serratia plymuthica]